MSLETYSLLIIFIILVQVSVVILLINHHPRSDIQVIHQKNNEYLDLHSSALFTPSQNLTLKNSQSWEEYRDFIVLHKHYENFSETTCSFYLVPYDGRPLPSFMVGQNITVKIPINLYDYEQYGYLEQLCALSDIPRSKYYRITLKKTDATTNYFSQLMFEDIHAGNVLQLKAPQGKLYTTEDMSIPLVLIGFDIGIAPLMAILNSALKTVNNKPIWLFYATQDGHEHIMREHLNLLNKNHKNLNVCCFYSIPNQNDQKGKDFHRKGEINISEIKNILKPNSYKFYLSGPSTEIKKLIPKLKEWSNGSEIYYLAFNDAFALIEN